MLETRSILVLCLALIRRKWWWFCLGEEGTGVFFCLEEDGVGLLVDKSAFVVCIGRG